MCTEVLDNYFADDEDSELSRIDFQSLADSLKSKTPFEEHQEEEDDEEEIRAESRVSIIDLKDIPVS